MAPIAGNERIEVLDVIRGFALIGIFLMNIEFFNRSTSEIGEGIPHGLTGLNWLAAFCIEYFVTGKFWTMFSVLFGMGFAVMLTRAQARGSEFLKPYARRVAVLAVFGTLHNILLWSCDILLSYAATASMLLLILFAPVRVYVLGTGLFGALAFIPATENFYSIAAVFAMAGWIALYLRNDRGIVHGFYAVIASLSLLFAAGMAVFSEKKDVALIAFLIAVFGFVLSYTLKRFHRTPEQRPLAAGVIYYLGIFLIAVAGYTYKYVTFHSEKNTVVQVKRDSQSDQKVAIPVTTVQQAEDRQVQNTLPKKEQKNIEASDGKSGESGEEKQLNQKNSYVDLVKLRARDLAESYDGRIFAALTAIAMFLIGYGVMRLGIMENAGAYIPQFKKLAWAGISIGWSINLASAYFATEHFPGKNDEAFDLASSMHDLSDLPACLGYLSLLVCLMHTRCAKYLLQLAPYGRMALTNYLGQSLIASTVFYGYGLGWYGMERAKQVVFVFAVVLLQIAFSHWWLARFRYGPMEWVWRAITYWTLPENRITRTR
ncbi:DUF418 domain-containing protein [Undibacterium squillarum]|uniref:DUF418 domain-containing protein n=1 Tax=Undibacterium squillarum TaxID=1131567 RepID=A0ABQ2XUW6_9BURK|nr:DUF418 domain-containing protein [Undibacterium squillarum]GGX35482.1 hypothetical protein GCM10010946_11170 [Undibacterium squillarum]